LTTAAENTTNPASMPEEGWHVLKFAHDRYIEATYLRHFGDSLRSVLAANFEPPSPPPPPHLSQALGSQDLFGLAGGI
jgi:hypothetical protein